MKFNKILALILTLAMMLSAMSTVVLASEENVESTAIANAYVSQDTVVSGWTTIWGQLKISGTENFYVEIYSDDTYMGKTSLVDDEKVILNGNDNQVTWHAFLDGSDSWWNTKWAVEPDSTLAPTEVKYYVDDKLIGTGVVKMSSPDDLKPVVWEELRGVKLIVATIGQEKFVTLQDAVEVADDNDTITLLAPVTLTEELILSKSLKFDGADLTTDGFLTIANGVSLEGENIKGTVYAEADATVNVNMPNANLIAIGTITFSGDNVVYDFDSKYYYTTINIGVGASLDMKVEPRPGMGYGNVYNITGNITDAKKADVANIKPSLSANGVSFGDGAGIQLNVKNAYIKFGSSQSASSKHSATNGTWNMSFENSIVEFGKDLYFAKASKDSLSPIVNFTLKDSVLTTATNLKFMTHESNVLIDNSIVNVKSSFMNNDKFSITNGSEVTINGYTTSSHGANCGELTVDNATFTVKGTAANNQFNGYSSAVENGVGKIVLKNNAVASIDYISRSEITIDASSTLNAQVVADDTPITITSDNLSNKKVLDLNETESRESKVTVPELSDNVDIIYGEDGDVSFKINIASIGETKYTSFEDAIKAANENAGSDTIVLITDVTPVGKFTLSDGDVLDLNEKTLYVDFENSTMNTATIKNGNIVLGRDDVHVCDGYFLINANKTLTVSNVDITSAEEGISTYAIFHLKDNAKLILNDSTSIDVKNNDYNGSIFYAGLNSAQVEATGITIKGENIGKGAVWGTHTYTDSTIELIGTKEGGLDHGFNGSNLTLNDTDLTVTGGSGRGITLRNANDDGAPASTVSINGKSNVYISDMGEGDVQFQNTTSTLSVEPTATLTAKNVVDKSGNSIDLSTSEQIVGDITVVADNAAIELVPVTATRTNDNVKLYNIVLKGELGHDIYEFIAAELTFENKSHTTGEPGSMKYIVTANDDEKLVLVENADKPAMYGFHIADDADRITKPEIILGQVEFVGNGTVDFKVTDALITATVYETNDELYYSSKANATNKVDITAATASGALDFATYTNLNVNLDFIHDTTSGNTAAYNGMTITVTGPLGYKKVGKIGTVADDADVVADVVNNKATLTFEDVVVGYRYTVKLEAPGYRTYTYATTIEKENPALRFWNDAKRGTDIDPKISIEDGKTETDVTFLVGDIAMDYIVDKYDLAAVTSYYGTYGVTNGNLIKYDLNRDGNIDILDIGYVIHGLGY